MRVSVIIAAAGESRRLGGDTRKPWLMLGGETIAHRACRKLRRDCSVSEIILAAHPDDLARIQGEWWDGLSAVGVTMAVAGGATRADSVWNALMVCDPRADLVAVHDAARPFLCSAVCAALYRTAARRGAAVPVLPLHDTIKRVEGDHVVETVRRHGLYRVQTPQVFHRDLLIEANEYVRRTGGYTAAEYTDDASLVEALGREVAAVLDVAWNIKITTADDLRLAEAILASGLGDE